MSVAVILAAGGGHRLGTSPKALLRLPDGRSFLAAIHASACAAGVERFVVVVGPPHDQATAAEASRLGMDVAWNPAPERGMASSVALGFDHVLATAPDDVALLWPVDHPAVQTATVQTILARAHVACAVVPTLGGRGGHPTVFGRDLWPELAACGTAPEGARTVLRGLAGRATDAGPCRVRVPVSDPGVRVDVDTPRALVEAGALACAERACDAANTHDPDAAKPDTLPEPLP